MTHAGSSLSSNAVSKLERLTELRRQLAVVPAAEVHPEPLPVPATIAQLLPPSGLPRGSVVVYSGAHCLLAGLLAATTDHGDHAAVVGLPRLGLLAVAEMGAALGRLAVIPHPGPDPVHIASVLLDGMDLVVLDVGGAAVPANRAQVLSARARSHAATLVVTGGTWNGSAFHIDTRVAGYEGLGHGTGRVRALHVDVRVRPRAGPPQRGRLDLRRCDGHVRWEAPSGGFSGTAA